MYCYISFSSEFPMLFSGVSFMTLTVKNRIPFLFYSVVEHFSFWVCSCSCDLIRYAFLARIFSKFFGWCSFIPRVIFNLLLLSNISWFLYYMISARLSCNSKNSLYLLYAYIRSSKNFPTSSLMYFRVY